MMTAENLENDWRMNNLSGGRIDKEQTWRGSAFFVLQSTLSRVCRVSSGIAPVCCWGGRVRGETLCSSCRTPLECCSAVGRSPRCPDTGCTRSQRLCDVTWLYFNFKQATRCCGYDEPCIFSFSSRTFSSVRLILTMMTFRSATIWNLELPLSSASSCDGWLSLPISCWKYTRKKHKIWLIYTDLCNL